MSELLDPLFNFLEEKGITTGKLPIVDDIFYQGPDRYLARDADGVFTTYNRTHVKARIGNLLPPGLTKGEARKLVDALLLQIDTDRVVDFSGFTAGYRTGYHVMGPAKFRMLVTRTNRPVKPEPGEWKLLKLLMTQLFGAEDSIQFQTVCAWLKVFYTDMLEVLYLDATAEWRQGQAAALVGPPGAGKTLFGCVLQALLGTTPGRPMDYATGKTQFNEELFESAILWIDDESTTEFKERAALAARLKQIVAASDLRRHAKYMKPLSVQARNRLLWCVNDNSNALEALPKMEDGVRDKIMLFLVNKTELPIDFGKTEGRREFWERISAELPAFGYFLCEEFEIPKHLHCGRFSVKTFHHPEVIEALENLEYENHLLELIDVAFEAENGLEATSQHRKPNGTVAKAWIGRSAALQHEITRFISAHEARMLFPRRGACGEALGKLAKLYPDRVMHGPKLHGNRKWIIWRSAKGDAQPF